MTAGTPRAAVVGLAGTGLSDAERAAFLKAPPAGFVLFKRNCAGPEALSALVADLKRLFPERWVPVLIDQEGGRVQRLRDPAWPVWPAPGRLAAAGGPDALGRLGSGLGRLLRAHGIDVNCAPCLDLAHAGATAAIGDRALGGDPAFVAACGRAFMAGLAAEGVAPVIKHLPGHGRASADSHASLPRVEASLDELRATDFAPFAALAPDAPFAMTGHILYPAIDPDHPATHSKRIVAKIIRGAFGFKGILFSDDLDMGALQGPVAERALLALDAGCDLALQCSGDLTVAAAVLDAVPPMPLEAFERLQAARPLMPGTTDDPTQLAAEAEALASIAGHHA